MFGLVFNIFMLFRCQSLVCAHYVEDWTPHILSTQLEFPWHKKSEVISSVNTVVLSPHGNTYKVKCKIYKLEDPRADVYTNDGILLDTLTLVPMDTACDKSFLRNHILPRDIEKGKLKIIYLWSSKIPKCVERTYTLDVHPFIATVARSSYPRVKCPETVVRLLKRNSADYRMAGGIVGVGPMGKTDAMDFNANVMTLGTPTYLEFPTKDFKGKVFKFICREDTLKSEDPETKRHTILTGSIVHEENDEIVLDEFRVTSCNIDFINVNRQVVNKVSRFKIVFQKVNGDCYEREYGYYHVNYFLNYNQVMLYHLTPKLVTCPEKFVGDIDLNAWRPMYKRVLRHIFRMNKPYSAEYSEPKKKVVIPGINVETF